MVQKRRRESRASSSHNTPTAPAPATYDTDHFASPAAAARHEKLRHRGCIPERGFQVSPRFEPIGKLITELLETRRWTTFGEQPQTKSIDSIVTEFYANLPDARNGKVMVRGKEVPCSAAAINRHYSTPNIPLGQDEYVRWLEGSKNMDDILRVVANPGTQWSYTRRHRLPFLELGDLNRYAKTWLYFVNARLYPTTSFSTIDCDRIYLLHAILSGISIDVGRFIAARMRTVPGEDIRPGLPFPSLITALCCEADVPITNIDIPVKCGSVITAEIIRRYVQNDDVDGDEVRTPTTNNDQEQRPSVPTSPSVPLPVLLDFVAHGMHYILSHLHYSEARHRHTEETLARHTAALGLPPSTPFPPFQYQEPVQWPPQWPLQSPPPPPPDPDGQ